MSANINECIGEYTAILKSGRMQAAYKAILESLGKARNAIQSSRSQYEVGGGIYQGYMDMSYFSLTTPFLKERQLKIAVVYVHDKGAFEAWLSARNRKVLREYAGYFGNDALLKISAFHDPLNADAIAEYTLSQLSDFSDQAVLTNQILSGTDAFVSAVMQTIGK